MAQWNGQVDTPICRCGATTFHAHLLEVLGGYDAHDFQTVYGDPETWT